MPSVAFRRDCVLAFSTHLDGLSLSFAQCEGVVPSVFMFFFFPRGNFFIPVCIFSLSVGRGEFKIFLCHHLKRNPSCIIILKVYFCMTERRGKQKQKRKLSSQDPNCETQTVCVSSSYFHTSSGSHQSWATLRLVCLLEPCCSEGQGACR